jgi:hypothetical protein
MGIYNCKSKCNNCEHPEGVQYTIEILDNLPKELLDKFIDNLQKHPNKSTIYIWKITINNWFNL